MRITKYETRGLLSLVLLQYAHVCTVVRSAQELVIEPGESDHRGCD